MTNKEKARKIANRHKIEYISGLKDGIGSSFIECMDSSMEMAEWKDAQFKEYLDKKAIEAGKKRDADLSLGSDWDEWNDRYWVYMNIIDELFPNEEKADYSDNDE